MDSTMQAVLQFVEENDVKFIRLAFCDVMGTLKNIAIMPSELPRAFETGVSFDASSILGFAPVDKSDLFLFPDAATLSVLPWRPQTGRVVRFFCSVRTADGSPYGADGRHILRRTLRRLAEDNGIPWQTKEYIAGGNDARTIQRSKAGVRVAAISAAVRYLHAPASVGCISDFENMRKLTRAFLDHLARI